MIVLGVDPGLSGAFVLLDTERRRLVAALDMPILRDGRKGVIVDGVAIEAWIAEWTTERPALAMVEEVEALSYKGKDGEMKRESGTSALVSGAVFGGILTTLHRLRVPIKFVRAGVWKAWAKVTGKPKVAVLEVARIRFGDPDVLELRRGHCNKGQAIARADAALIADFAAPKPQAFAVADVLEPLGAVDRTPRLTPREIVAKRRRRPARKQPPPAHDLFG